MYKVVLVYHTVQKGNVLAYPGYIESYKFHQTVSKTDLWLHFDILRKLRSDIIRYEELDLVVS